MRWLMIRSLKLCFKTMVITSLHWNSEFLGHIVSYIRLISGPQGVALWCFSTPFGHLVHLGLDARLVWFGRRMYPRAFFTPNRSVARAIPDNCGANQWGRTGVSGNDNHSLLITSKESQFAIQFFHYRLPLCPVQLCAVSWVNIVAKSNKFPFPMILVWDRKWVNVARYSVEENLIGWWVGSHTHFVSRRQTVGRSRERPRRTRRWFFTPYLGVRRRTERPMEWKSAFRVPMCLRESFNLWDSRIAQWLGHYGIVR